jgi:ComF family protein
MSIGWLVAPVRCVLCRAYADDDLCESCAQTLDVVCDPVCARCGTPRAAPCDSCDACADLDGFRRARSVLRFEPPARALTLALKRRGRGALGDAAGSLLAALAAREGLHCDVVTFVPAGRRAAVRGFDHARLLARAAGAALRRPCVAALARVGTGRRQADVPQAMRRANAAGAFAARMRLSGERVLLVDDVFTTGATVEACARELRRAGAAEVDVVTLARTIRRLPRGAYT